MIWLQSSSKSSRTATKVPAVINKKKISTNELRFAQVFEPGCHQALTSGGVDNSFPSASFASVDGVFPPQDQRFAHCHSRLYSRLGKSMGGSKLAPYHGRKASRH
jgi:hypothetical protein